MARALFVVAMLAFWATGVQAKATKLIVFKDAGCKTLDETYEVTSGGDLCSGCTEMTGTRGTRYANMKSLTTKNEIEVFPNATCASGREMSFSSSVMADWDNLKRGLCIDANVIRDNNENKGSMQLKGTCPVAAKNIVTGMAKRETLGGLLFALVAMHVTLRINEVFP